MYAGKHVWEIYFLAVDAGIRQKMSSQNSIILHTVTWVT